MLDETAARFEAEPYPAFDELQVFSTFKWMMDETQKKAAGNMGWRHLRIRHERQRHD